MGCGRTMAPKHLFSRYCPYISPLWGRKWGAGPIRLANSEFSQCSHDWDAHLHLLRQSRDDGDWHIALELEADHSYCFRYLVDGEEWMDDDHADDYEPNAYGGFDSVVRT